MIRPLAQRVASGGTVRIVAEAPTPLPQRQMHLLLCERNANVSVPRGMVAVWLPLRDGLWVNALGARFFVGRGEVFVSDLDHAHAVNLPIGGLSLALIGSNALWAELLGAPDQGPDAIAAPALFPSARPVAVGLRRLLLRLARAALLPGEPCDAPALQRFGQLLAHLQQDMATLLERCPGPSLVRKRRVFQRLQRARHHIQTSSPRDIDIASLARLTSYSPNQLIKLFQRVFGETPYASLLRTRVERARQLITQSSMAIREISFLSGFQNKATFSRAFKLHFGNTASSFRNATATSMK